MGRASRSKASIRRARREMDALYAELPTLECRGLCADACGPILMTPLEGRRIVELTGSPPGIRDDMTCSLLQDRRCTVYAARPMICRLWGLVESLPCLWGCQPSRVLTDVEGFQFLERANQIGAVG